VSLVDPGLTPNLDAWFAAFGQHGQALREAIPCADPSLPRSCCQLATRASRCTCLAHTTCPNHGDHHYGTHD